MAKTVVFAVPLDSILVALINEAALANAPAHRRAARIVLEWIRCSRGGGGPPDGLSSADVPRDVREHVRHLIEHHGLGLTAVAGPT